MTNKTLILLVDDQPHNLDVLVNYLGESYLAEQGLELMVATSGSEALDIARQRPPTLVLLDVMMPGMDGFEVCRRLQAGIITKEVPVIFMSALTDTHSKVEGFTAGAVDFVSKPIQREEVLARINAHLTLARQQQELLEKNRQLERLNSELQEQIDRRLRAESAYQLADQTLSSLTRQEAQTWGIDAFVGQSPAIVQLLDEVRSLQLAPRTNVLVLGESGTGKELIARAVHYGSARRDKAFIAVNCAAIPAELADAEFFGHTKGAFTGATSDRHGYFEQANGGTLFLDEIGDMPLPLQAKLLRVLEDGLVTPVGGKYSRKLDVRIVAATNVDMRNRIQRQEFRQDLYFRLASYSISLPPLRERIDDVPILVAHFLSQLGGQMGRDKPAITAEALLQLNQYHYPGNVRELKNLIEYALIASRGQIIQPRHLHFLEPLQESPELAATPNSATGETSNKIPRINTDSEEQQLLNFAHTKGRIDNLLAQELLRIDHGRASYLLKKLHREGRLRKQGERRWTYYTAAE